MSHDFKIGDLVTYVDIEPEDLMLGTVVEPTAEEVAHARTFEYPVGPEYGDIAVEWDEPGCVDCCSSTRAWHRPEDIEKVVAVQA